MALTIHEWFDRKGRETWEASQFTRTFLATSNDGSDTVADVLDDAGVPQIGDVHPDWASATVRDRRASADLRQDPTQDCRWMVVIIYSTASPTVPTSDNPEDLETTIAFSFSRTLRRLDKAYDTGVPDPQGAPTKPLANSAGFAFVPPIEQEDANLLITINRNEAISVSGFDPDRMRDYQNTINDAAITIAGVAIPIYSGHFRDINARPMKTRDGTKYYSVTYEIEVSLLDWKLRLTDRGLRERVQPVSVAPNNLKNRPILDEHQREVTEPVWLDGDGQKLEAGAPVELEFVTYYPADWTVLNLPTTYT